MSAHNDRIRHLGADIIHPHFLPTLYYFISLSNICRVFSENPRNEDVVTWSEEHDTIAKLGADKQERGEILGITETSQTRQLARSRKDKRKKNLHASDEKFIIEAILFAASKEGIHVFDIKISCKMSETEMSFFSLPSKLCVYISATSATASVETASSISLKWYCEMRKWRKH